MQIKNPYYINFLWMSIALFILGFILLSTCCYGDYCFKFQSRTENILIGIFSSIFLLLFLEITNWIIDRQKYGFLHGKYKKVFITQINENRMRSSEIDNASEKEQTDKIKFINDSCYHELDYYDCDRISYFTNLKYHYHGIYTGYVEYFDHIRGNWKENKMIKIKAKVTLNLNSANKMTGSGSYKYVHKNDFGKYEFQVDEENAERIIVNYRNTLPSGLAEGYEIWEKI